VTGREPITAAPLEEGSLKLLYDALIESYPLHSDRKKFTRAWNKAIAKVQQNLSY